MNISHFAVRRPITTCMFFSAIVVLGWISFQRLAVDQLPDVALPSITVSTTYEGAGPAEVERLITEYIEKAVSTIDGVKEVRSTSKENNSTVVIDFTWDKDLTEAVNEVREKVAEAKRLLPEDIDEPRIWKYDTSAQPIVYLALRGASERFNVRQYAEDYLAYLLQQTEGVAAMDVWGGNLREIQVLVDRGRLESTGLSLAQVEQALRAENLSLAGGRLEAGAVDYLVRPTGEFGSLADIEQAVVALRDGIRVAVKDVAAVVDGLKDERTRTRVNGEPGVILAIRKQSGGNTVRVAQQVRACLPEIQEQLPQGLSLSVLYDRSTFITRSIKQVQATAIQGGAIAVLVLLVFLRSLISTVVIAVSIPIAIIATFILLHFWHISLNWMSLGGLALGIGMLVDNSVVVLENIFRHAKLGKDRQLAAMDGSAEVGLAVAASTLTTLCVFMPIVFVRGKIGVIFQELALTVTASLLASLLVALTLTPMLCGKILRVRDEQRQPSSSLRRWLEFQGERFFNALDVSYQRSLAWALSHRALVVVMSLTLLAMVLPLNRHIGQELLPAVDESLLYARLEMPVGTRIDLTDETMRQLERTILANPLIQGSFSRTGLTSRGGGGSHTGFMFIEAVDRTQREETLDGVMQALRQDTRLIPGGKIRIYERPSDLRRLWGGGREERVEVDIRGFDLLQAKAFAERISEVIAGVDGVSHTQLTVDDQMPEIQLRIDRAMASALGIRASDILHTVKTALEGTETSKYREGGSQYDIRVRLQEADRQAWDDLGRLFVLAPSGQTIPLRNLATLHPAKGPMAIERRGQQRVVTVQAALTGGREFSDLMREVEQRVLQVQRPDGLTIRFAGEVEEMKESRHDIILAFALALLLVYMVMASLYESLLHPFVIMFTVVFSSVGIILALWLTGTHYTIPVYIGIIMLAGIVVNNGIILVDYTNQLGDSGIGVREALLQAGRTRLRPILITTLTTVLALLPMSLGYGEGAEMWSPLGRVVVGGLSVSTLFTLFFIPVLYSLMEEVRRHLQRLRGKKLNGEDNGHGSGVM
jgi:HAE1 family hydrophobic/amphiphilic exporter-1